jgi:protein subunit release factor A
MCGRIPELERLMNDPSVVGNPREMQRVGRELSELRPIAQAYDRYRKIAQELEENRQLLETEKDAEMRSMAREEVSKLSEEQERLAAEIRILLLPRDPNDEKNILIEIRAGAGGEEAGLFATELFRAYTVRSERASIFQIGVFSNKWMQYAVGVSLALLLLVCVVPFLQNIFNTHWMSGMEWATVLGLGLIPAVSEEITKFFLRRQKEA